MSILELLRSDGFITVNKYLAKTVGLHEAIVLAELISHYKYFADLGKLDDNGMFYVTVEKMEDNTTLSKHLQSKAISTLQNLGLIESRQKGLPARRFFKINEEAVYDLFADKKLKILTTDNGAAKSDQKPENPRHDQKLKFLTTGGEKFEQLEVKNFDSNKELYINNNLIKKEEEEEERVSEIEPVISVFHSQGKIKTSTPVKELLSNEQAEFLSLVEKNKIPVEMALKIVTNLDINDYSVSAIRRTFKKAMSRVANGSIYNFSNWFVEAIKNEQLHVEKKSADEAAAKKMGF